MEQLEKTILWVDHVNLESVVLFIPLWSQTHNPVSYCMTYAQESMRKEPRQMFDFFIMPKYHSAILSYLPMNGEVVYQYNFWFG